MSRVTTVGRGFVRGGQRWFWLADTSWKLWIKGTRVEIEQYMNKRQSQGFTAMQCVAIRGNDPNAEGNRPYNGSLSDLNEPYWDLVDWCVEGAFNRGMVMAMLPIWSKDQVGSVITESNAFAYGQFLANRYAQWDNVVWMLGGDDSASGREQIWRNLASGLDSGSNDNIQTFHPAGRTSSTQWFNNDTWIDFHAIQTGAYTTWSTARSLEDTAEANNGSKPWINAEPFYEDHNINWDNNQGWATAIYPRRDAYWSVLAGAAGYTYGCWPVVHFARQDGDPYDGVHGPWQDYMDTEGANQMRHVRALFESRPRVEPNDSLVSNPGSDTSWTPAALAGDSSTLIAYLASGGSRTIDLAQLSGSTCRPWWFNPRTAAVTQLGDRSSTGTDSFTAPSNDDWVLVIDDVALGYAAPGQVSTTPPGGGEEPPPSSDEKTFGTTIGSGGFRFYDANHEISYNYVQGVYGGNFQGPMLLDTGDAEGSSSNLAGHWRVVNALVERNVLVANPEGIRIGDNYDSAPTGCTIRDNIVAQAESGTAITQKVAPVNTTLTNNAYFATPAGGGLTQDSTGVWRKAGYGPRVSFLQASDVGITGDPNDSDGTGSIAPPGDGGDTPPPPDADTAAAAFGWGAPIAQWSDEFDYEGTPNPDIWGLPGSDWAGHAGNGRRRPERTTVTGGKMVMTGLQNGDSGWVKHNLERQYGRYEMRCRSFPGAPSAGEPDTTSNGNDYHPVSLIWPTSEQWPEDGEYDWVENGQPGDSEAQAFLHYPTPGTDQVQQEHFTKPGVDLSEWHNFGFEWSPEGLVLYLDGVEWGRASGGANSVRRNIQDMPSGHGNIQLDNFDGTDQSPATFEIEFYRVYSLTPSGPPAGAQSVTAIGIPSAERVGVPAFSGAVPSDPPGSHPTLLGTTDTVLPFTLGYTIPGGDDNNPPDPAGSQTVTGVGRIASAQEFGQPVLSVDDGPQTLVGIAITSTTDFDRPLITVDPAAPAAPGGVLVPALYAVGADGTTLTPLPSWAKITLSPMANSPGTLTVEYPAGALGFSTLNDGVSAYPLKALEIRMWVGGNATGSLGGWLVQKEGDDLTPGSLWTFTGYFHEWILSKALVAAQPISEANPKGELRFASATAGLVLSTIMNQAQARGALPLVTRDFDENIDSNGQPWTTTVSSLAFAPKTTVQQVADKIVELGMCEYELTAARVWRAYNAGTRGTDQTTGASPLTFAHAINLREHSRRESSKDAGTAVLAAGSEGFYSWATSASAEAELGWRAEVGADAGQLDSADAVRGYASTHLEAIRHGIAEHIGAIEFEIGARLPFIDWGVGDWAFTWVGGTRRKLRIAQIGVVFEQEGPPRGTVALNDLITDKVALLYRRLNAISAGAAVVGTSTPTPGGTGEDRIPPSAPTGLTVTSKIAFQVPGETATRAMVSAGWAPVITDAYADEETANKSRAATMVGDRMAAAIAVGRIATDSTTAGRVNAAQLISERLTQALDGLSDSTIFEDWTWEGMPAIVAEHHDALITEFLAAGFSGPNITLSEQARDWLRDYQGPTSDLYENWTWDGAPDVVQHYAPILKEEFGQTHPDQNLPDFPEQVAVIAQAWLADYAVAHQGGGAVSGDVDHYRVQYTYIGHQPIDPELIEQGLVADTTWVEPEGSPTRATSLTFGNIEGGRSLGVRVAAVDRADNQGPWTPMVAVDTAADDKPPPVPSTPVGAAWFRTIDWTWDGKGSAGEDMLAAAPDFASGGYVELHVDQGLDFIPDRPLGPDGKVDLSQSTTFIALLYGGGTWNQPGLTVGTTYFARLVAVDRNGNASEPSASSNGVMPQQLVSIDYGPHTIEGIHIKNAAIGNAQIANAAINSAKIEEVSAGLLSAGTMTAQVTVAGRFATPEINGNKLEFDSTGIRLFQSGTVVGHWQVSDASVLVTGTYRSGLTGERINILPSGTIRIYGATGVDYGELANAAGAWVATSRPDSFGRRSRIDFAPEGLTIRYGTGGAGTRTTASFGLTYGVLNAPVTGIRVLTQFAPDDGTQNRFHFVHANANGDINDSTLHYVLSGGNNPAILAPGLSPLGAGVKFVNDSVMCVNGAGTDVVTCQASAFNQGSSELRKRDIAPARFGVGRTAREVVDRVAVYGFRYDGGQLPPRSVPLRRRQSDGSMRIEDVPVDTTPTGPPPRRFSVIAEHLESIAPELVRRNAEGDLVIDVGDRLGVVWEAVREISRELRELRSELRSEVTPPVIVESHVQDPSRWAELPNGDQ